MLLQNLEAVKVRDARFRWSGRRADIFTGRVDMTFVALQDVVEGLIDPLDETASKALARASLDGESAETIFVCGPCTSSLDVAWHLISSGRLACWDSVLCSSQWAGRGQMRRAWVSPGGNLYAAWKWPNPPREWSALLPLVVGYVMQRFFAEIGIELRIKWPNDLLFGNLKVGGILIEEKHDGVVVGVGMNLVSSPDDTMLRNDICMRAGNLARFFQETDFVSLWVNLVSRGRSCYMSLLTSCTPAEFVSMVTPLLAFLRQNVRTITGEQEYHARLMGLHEDGGLVLEHRGHREILYSGSILPLA